MTKTTLGIIGLGKMGFNMAVHATELGYGIVGYDPYLPALPDGSQVQLAASLEALVDALPSPRKIFVYIPAGKAIDVLIGQLTPLLQPGDMIVDGGNSYWGDSIRRAKDLLEKDIHLIDCGTSGGVDGARNGACFMVGGDAAAVEQISGFLREMAVPNGYTYTGPSGSGHFVKLVHNGIEFGMLQAIGEGMDLLSKYPAPLNISEILLTWNNGSVIRSWLIELMKKIYDEKLGFNVPSYVEDTGEVNWLVHDAMQMEVAVPVIAQSIMQLISSRDSEHTWAKAVAMMRNGFGGHPFGPDEGIKFERKHGRVGGFPF